MNPSIPDPSADELRERCRRAAAEAGHLVAELLEAVAQSWELLRRLREPADAPTPDPDCEHPAG